MYYEGETSDGTRVRVFIRDDTAWMTTLAPGEHSTWTSPLDLAPRVDDGGGPP